MPTVRAEAGLCFLIFTAVLSAPVVLPQSKPVVAPPSRTDTFAETESGHKLRVQHGEVAKENFQIAGVNLQANMDVIQQARRILGRVRTSATGDGSTFEEKACYRAAEAGDATHLLVGHGEVDHSFELSASGRQVKSGMVCRSSNAVSRLLATGSGVRLGQSPDEVVRILGLPTRHSRNAKTHREVLVYSFGMKKRTAPKDLQSWARQHPELGRSQVETDYGYGDMEEEIRAEFVDDRLDDLWVDWLETY